jgi:hypothetical protein
MKKFLFLIVVLGIAVQSFGQTSTQKEKVSGPVITFEKNTHDFGEIYQGDKVEHVFKFTNTGNEPLIITNIQISCGCTTPQWPHEPIPPGAKGEITVGFNSAGKSGLQNKSLPIQSNATNTDEAKIIFTTNVLMKKQGE